MASERASMVDVLAGESGVAVDANLVVAQLRHAGRDVVPFDARVMDFTSELARFLRQHPTLSRVPAVAALAFWIRPARVKALAEAWERMVEHDEGLYRSPRGVVFHVPPSNVDTLFIYSWLLSALTGNANIVRISSTASIGTLQILAGISEVVASNEIVSDTTAFVQYGHDADVTSALSSADGRVIWGGDDTVRAIRSVPMNPLGFEIAFADRESAALLDADSVIRASDDQLTELVRLFFNDSYWFDQLGCSSPRTVFFRGAPAPARKAADLITAELTARVRAESYSVQTGALMNKLVVAAAVASDGGSDRILWDAPEVTVIEQRQGDSSPVAKPGGGLFSYREIQDLSEIIPHVSNRTQTLTHYGIDREELEELVSSLNGAGIDRIVPVGQALNFDRFWDGYDLLRIFSKCTVIVT